jgi:hypothetical protein
MTSLNQSLIRTNFKRSYNFQRHTKDDKILVTNNLSFSVCNPLSEAVPYFAKMEFEEGQTPAKIGVSVALNGKEHLRHNRFQPSVARRVRPKGTPSRFTWVCKSRNVRWVAEVRPTQTPALHA